MTISSNESSFPAFFTEFAIGAMASKLAMPITDDRGIEELKTVKAFGSPSDNYNGGLFGVCKKLDSMQDPTSAIRADTLLSARFS